jgi:ABC-type phosphate transport system substrate-binding protein
MAGTSAELGRAVLAQTPDALVMVVNHSNPVDKVSKADAKRLLMGQMSNWPNGAKVVVALRPPSNQERAAVLEKVCGMTEVEFTRFQMQVLFTGKSATVLQEEPTPAAIKSFVKATPGAVGFLHPADVDAGLKAVLTL